MSPWWERTKGIDSQQVLKPKTLGKKEEAKPGTETKIETKQMSVNQGRCYTIKSKKGQCCFPQCDVLSEAWSKLADGAVGSHVMFKTKAVASEVP